MNFTLILFPSDSSSEIAYPIYLVLILLSMFCKLGFTLAHTPIHYYLLSAVHSCKVTWHGGCLVLPTCGMRQTLPSVACRLRMGIFEKILGLPPRAPTVV